MVAMQQVSNHLRAFPDHRAVMVAVEICSAAYFLDDRLESAVAHAIFADGAGAIAISRRRRRARRSSSTARMFRSEHLGAMGFEYPGGRPRVVLSKDVRRIGAGMMKEMADALMAAQGLKKEDIAPLRAALRGPPGDRAGGEADGPRREHGSPTRGACCSSTATCPPPPWSSCSTTCCASREPVPGDWGLMIAPRARASRPRARCSAGSMPLFPPLARAAGVLEIIDGPPVAFDDMACCMTDIARVNGLFGGRMVTMSTSSACLAALPADRPRHRARRGHGGGGHPARAGALGAGRGPAHPRVRAGSRRGHPQDRGADRARLSRRSPSCAATRCRCRSGRARSISPSPR